MLSKHHLALSLATGALLLLVAPPTTPWWHVLGLASALGVLVDLDHFVVARLNQGDWRATQRALRNPRYLVLDQERLFDEDALWARQRLLSHAVIATTVVAGLVALTSPWLAVVAATTLWVHLLADLAWDNHFTDRDFRRHARALGYDA